MTLFVFISGDKLPPPSYYEALRYPLEADDRYSPVEYVEVQADDDEADFYSTFNQGNFKSLSQTELFNENTEHHGPSKSFKQVEHNSSSSSENTSTIIPKDVQNPNLDIGKENESTNLKGTFEICEVNNENLSKDAIDLDIVQSSIKAADDTYEHLREPDVIQEGAADIRSVNDGKDSYEVLEECISERSENEGEHLTETSRDISEVHLRNQSSFKGFSNGCRPISGITTRSFSPEPGPSGYTGAKNKGLKKMAAVSYDSRNGSYRTLPTSSSENVNSVQDMVCISY